MAWIESNQEVGRHPKTKKLARLLGIPVVAAVGHLHFLWWWALDFAQEGVLSKYDEYDISEACMWEGDEKLFVDALIQAGFIDNNESILSIHDWYEYAGRLIERRQSDAERKREERNKRKKTPNNGLKKITSSGHPTDIHEESTDVLRNSTVPNQTVPDQTNIDIVVDRAREEILAGLPEMEYSVSIPGDFVSTSAELVTNSTESVNNQTEALNATMVNAIAFAEQNFGRCLKQFECEQMCDWMKQFAERGSPDPDAILIAGLQRCIKQGAFKVSYLEGIINDWLNHGVTTLEHIASRDEEWNANKERKRAGKEHKGGGVLPRNPSNKYDGFYL